MNTPFNVQQVAVIGAGTMGRGIVISLASHGIAVLWLDSDPRSVETGMKMAQETWASQVAKGRITFAEVEQNLARIQAVDSYEALAQVDLVIEAVYENLELKQEIFRVLDAMLKPRAILASNTSTLDIDAIASVTQRPQQVLGLHFFSPAHIMKLLEIVRGKHTAVSVLDAVQTLGQRIGKVTVVAGNCKGFIGNRMLASYVTEARMMVLEGAYPLQVDEALQQFGFAMGPFRMYDVVGIDLEWRARQLAGEGMDHPTVQIDNALCELGRFGQKSQKGYYRYAEGSRQAEHDAAVDALVLEIAAGLGFRRREIKDEEIVERCLLALVNEGAKILEENIAANSQDIDIVYLNGYGFPKNLGGPMQWADAQGIKPILERLTRLQHLFGNYWQPADLIASLAATGKQFSDVKEVHL
ncbi:MULTISPECIES: 3-hydroxyacyl-CoA dehydrogenase [unclassified Pseudomonas]|uniref:3-hydroxyacyl-CoA dehydrogenase n=1 Tax=unclassified Pseudomonas TaxID=196821 RepID=UPI000C88598C|nr:MULTISPECIES: 3-hydroxyacyl-CoA dehydrogenase [unclassified Pseudomonas]PMZ73386.1 3-hydroxyacyl-CoA dehydrogenase [Pseudomonas sp. GW247-3R2A]PMY73516.1 3-hydroxyacyl-CoA dehydrogenase [Pseudomonas sp. MPR-R3A]PMY98196.1 3-hydroxyacyl-CoA dehydrogenase [Pseudomonas sp. FW305-124]PNA92770.1 3-hydroxyacyl-CoA dehydrogenase [Pseudomonas sp. FW300-E2]PNB03336.1 3-hydroxyacyl-CoA dehydrogenase [Pseudomonas sp. MPR-AND1B]